MIDRVEADESYAVEQTASLEMHRQRDQEVAGAAADIDHREHRIGAAVQLACDPADLARMDACEQADVAVGRIMQAGRQSSGRVKFSSGEAAVDRALKADWDMILMDVHMPQLDGIEASRILRANAYTGRIWALTASTLGEERERCMQAGMDGFLSKPLGIADLRAVLARAFHQR